MRLYKAQRLVLVNKSVFQHRPRLTPHHIMQKRSRTHLRVWQIAIHIPNKNQRKMRPSEADVCLTETGGVL